MSKEKTLRTLEETEVMQATGIPAQETEGAGVVMATEIIADLKEQLQEAKEEAKAVTLNAITSTTPSTTMLSFFLILFIQFNLHIL